MRDIEARRKEDYNQILNDQSTIRKDDFSSLKKDNDMGGEGLQLEPSATRAKDYLDKEERQETGSFGADNDMGGITERRDVQEDYRFGGDQPDPYVPSFLATAEGVKSKRTVKFAEESEAENSV